MTLDMEDHTTTDSTLGILRRAARGLPRHRCGAAGLPAPHRGATAATWPTAGCRVRLCKGAYDEPESVAYQTAAEVDRSYVRCLKVLMAGEGYPMVATHDPRLVEIAADACARAPRPAPGQLRVPDALRHPPGRAAAAGRATGERVRVYVPYGDEWYGYLVRRMAERPANLVASSCAAR